LREKLTAEAGETEVLNNDCVNLDFLKGRKHFKQGLKLNVFDKYVHGHKHTHTMRVSQRHKLAQIVEVEILSSSARVEIFQAKKNSICSRVECGQKLFPSTDWGKNLGNKQGAVGVVVLRLAHEKGLSSGGGVWN
jgi:hypothetical protein